MPRESLTIAGPNPGETIRIDPPVDGRYHVQRTVPKLGGPMQPTVSLTPWTFAYAPDTARTVLDWMTDAQG